MSYRKMIEEITEAYPGIETNPAHIEAWMRSARGTLDALSPEDFRKDVLEALCCARMYPAESAALAATYGLN
jgi:hypothetical protein